MYYQQASLYQIWSIRIFFFFGFLLFDFTVLFGQELKNIPEFNSDTRLVVSFPDTIITPAVTNYQDEDSADQVIKPKLLPDKLSFGERMMWGEQGLFREIGLAPLNPDARKSELSLRRTMLTTHQIGGFISLATMITTCYYGQRIIDGRKDFTNKKNLFVATTIISYTITGLLSILSPPPMIRRDEQSTTTTHKYLAWAHVTGMILTPILANGIRFRETGTGGVRGKELWNMDKAHFHQIAGYITTALFTAAMISVTF